jgi:hypothetical protein
MSSWEVRNAVRKNLVTVIEWENTKKYNELLSVLKAANLIQDETKVQILLESFGLAFSIIERSSGREVLFIKLSIEEKTEDQK